MVEGYVGPRPGADQPADGLDDDWGGDALGRDPAAWQAWAQARGWQGYRGRQIFSALHAGGVEQVDDLRALPARWRERWRTAAGDRLVPVEEVRRLDDADGTSKAVLRLHDGAQIECVLIPTAERRTVCVSSQVGCPLACAFCASGADGWRRDLSPGEIVAQVLHHRRQGPVSNLVFMGSGEPLLNLDAVLTAIRLLGDPAGLHLGRRRCTVSTVGVVEGISRLGAEEPQVNLALSLHAVDDAIRSRLVPANRRWPLAAVRRALDAYRACSNRRLTFEYCLIAGINTSEQQARALAAMARAHGALINAIRYHPVPGGPFAAPQPDEVAAFIAAVEDAGGYITLRTSRGADIAAACGQLVGDHDAPSKETQ